MLSFLRELGLIGDFKLNFEANHATLPLTPSSTSCRPRPARAGSLVGAG